MTGAPPASGSRARRLARSRRCHARASPRTFEAAAQSFGGFEMLPQLVESGHFRREYRDHRLEWMLRSGGVDIVLDGMRKGNIRFSHELS